MKDDKFFDKLDMYQKVIRQKLEGKDFVCEYCKKQIKRRKFYISWFMPKKYAKSKYIPDFEWTRLRNVRCSHYSCADKMRKYKWFTKP